MVKPFQSALSDHFTAKISPTMLCRLDFENLPKPACGISSIFLLSGSCGVSSVVQDIPAAYVRAQQLSDGALMLTGEYGWPSST